MSAPSQPRATRPSPPQSGPPQEPQTRQQRREKEGRSGGQGGASSTRKPDAEVTSVGPWRIGRTVGEGSSGNVFSLLSYEEESELIVGESVLGRVKLAKHKHTGQYAAVKIIPKPRRTQQEKTAKVSPSRSVDKEVKRERADESENANRSCWESRRKSLL